MPSTEYKVELIQNGDIVSAFVYQMNAMHTTNNSKQQHGSISHFLIGLP
jgi:hypothetical protein